MQLRFDDQGYPIPLTDEERAAHVEAFRIERAEVDAMYAEERQARVDRPPAGSEVLSAMRAIPDGPEEDDEAFLRALERPVPGRIDPTYLALIHRLPLRPLRTEADYDAATALMNDLIDGERSSGQDDYLAVLGDLIAAYDDEHHPMPAATQGAILRMFLDDRGISQAELARATGIPESNVSAMLKDQRGIGKNARAVLAKFFEVESTDFVVE